jgi:hypothetical protein
MRMSENTADLFAALAKAQGAFEKVAAAKKGQDGHRTFKYAPLSSIMNAIRKPLAENGLALTGTPTIEEGDKLILIQRLVHGDQWIEATYPLAKEAISNHKQFGLALTYGRRYLISALCCVAPEEEDDLDAVADEPVEEIASAPVSSAHAKREGVWEAFSEALWATDDPKSCKAWFDQVKAGQLEFAGVRWGGFSKKWKDAAEHEFTNHYDGLCRREMDAA